LRRFTHMKKPLWSNTRETFIKCCYLQLMLCIAAGCLLALSSADDFLIASFTAGSGATTLPMEIFSHAQESNRNINALIILNSGGWAESLSWLNISYPRILPSKGLMFSPHSI